MKVTVSPARWRFMTSKKLPQRIRSSYAAGIATSPMATSSSPTRTPSASAVPPGTTSVTRAGAPGSSTP